MGLPLWIVDYLGTKSKGMFDWNWLDAFLVGLSSAVAVIPGWDHFGGIFLGALFVNYRREAAAKYSYFALAPLLLGKALFGLRGLDFHMPSPMLDVSWLSFAVSIIVSFFAGLLAIGGFLKHIQHSGLKKYVLYRWVVAVGIAVVYWSRSHGN